MFDTRTSLLFCLPKRCSQSRSRLQKCGSVSWLRPAKKSAPAKWRLRLRNTGALSNSPKFTISMYVVHGNHNFVSFSLSLFLSWQPPLATVFCLPVRVGNLLFYSFSLFLFFSFSLLLFPSFALLLFHYFALFRSFTLCSSLFRSCSSLFRFFALRFLALRSFTLHSLVLHSLALCSFALSLFALRSSTLLLFALLLFHFLLFCSFALCSFVFCSFALLLFRLLFFSFALSLCPSWLFCSALYCSFCSFKKGTGTGANHPAALFQKRDWTELLRSLFTKRVTGANHSGHSLQKEQLERITPVALNKKNETKLLPLLVL